MKIYEACLDYFARGTSHGDDWSDYVDWEDLLNEGFTHILNLGIVYPMWRFGIGPGIEIPYRVVEK